MIDNFKETWKLLNLNLFDLKRGQIFEVMTDFAMIVLKWLCFMFAIILLFWLFYPYKPIRVDEFKVWPDVVEQGQEVNFQFVGEKFIDIPVKVLIEVVNGSRIELIKYESNMPTGDRFKRRSFIMPYTVKPEKVMMCWTGTYKVNPVREISYTKCSKYITVLARTKLIGKQGIKGNPGRPGKNSWNE